MYKLLSRNKKENIIYKELTIRKSPEKKIIWFKNGFYYKGETENTYLHGKGILLLGDGSYYQGKCLMN